MHTTHAPQPRPYNGAGLLPMWRVRPSSIRRNRLRPASKILLFHGTNYKDSNKHYTTNVYSNHQRNNTYSMYNWCKHQINYNDIYTKSRSRLSPRIRRESNPEPFVFVTKMFPLYCSTLLPCEVTPPSPLAPVTHRFHPLTGFTPGYARSAHGHRAAPDSLVRQNVL